jgi:hypothetical protein
MLGTLEIEALQASVSKIFIPISICDVNDWIQLKERRLSTLKGLNMYYPGRNPGYQTKIQPNPEGAEFTE